MTDEEKRKVLEALWIIKRECFANCGHCNRCMMFNEWGRHCSLYTGDPCAWDLPPMPE